MKCDQCEVVIVNGIATHELGCPNYWRHPLTNEPYIRVCDWCGSDFTPEESRQDFCSEECAFLYHN